MPARLAPASTSPGRPKSAQKRAAILDAAQCLFLQQGFERTRMEQIASRAGVSKLTVYSHFGDKDGLFFAAIERRCREQVPDALFRIVPGTPPETALRTIADGIHALMSSPESIALRRMLMSESRNAERLGTLFWEAGPARLAAGLEAFLREAVARGELDIPEPEEAATQLLRLLDGDCHKRLFCGGGGAPAQSAREHVDAVLRLFLRAYGARPAAPAGN